MTAKEAAAKAPKPTKKAAKTGTTATEPKAAKPTKKTTKLAETVAASATQDPVEGTKVAQTAPAATEIPEVTKPAKKTAKAKPTKSTDIPAGDKLPGHGRKYAAAFKLVDRDAKYDAAEAASLVKQTSTVKFDATVEVHLRLGLNPRKAEENIRGTVKLPAGTGKTLIVMAFVPEAQAAAAKKAGADFVSDVDTKKKIADGWTEFDVAVATPDQMAEVAKLGKVLGPKGLMPNPKAGTVSDKPADAIAEVKKGTIEYRLAKDGTIHAGIGKVSFSDEDLLGNLKAYYQAILAAKPTDLKGIYIKSVTIASTMGPGIRLNPDSLAA